MRWLETTLNPEEQNSDLEPLGSLAGLHACTMYIHTKYILLALFGLHDGTPPRVLDLGP